MSGTDYTPIHSGDRCTLRGTCMENDRKTGSLSCVYNGRPALAAAGSQELEIVRSLCPMVYKGEEDTKLCCDLTQLVILQNQTKAAKQILGGCPSCVYNFMDLFCRLTCDPDQASYMAVTGLRDVPGKPGVEAVTSLALYLGEELFFQLYQSCLHVQFSSSQSRALDLLCGRPADSCSAADMLAFLGGESHSPFPIDYIYANRSDSVEWEKLLERNITPYNGRQFRCNETAPPNNKTCSCQVRQYYFDL